MISLDATTLSSYLAASTADARAQAVIDSLTGTVYVRVYDGSTFTRVYRPGAQEIMNGS